jgi:hypothetical protein
MSVLLYGAGAIAFVAGAVMLGIGIPVHEFSFGNTMIIAGVVAMAGGLIVAALGLVVAQVQQLTEALTRGAPVRPGRSPLPFEAASRLPAAPARIPFPPRPASDQKFEMSEAHEPMRDEFNFAAPAGPALHEPAYDHSAPMLPNPDEPSVTVDDEISLSPRHPFAPSAPADLHEAPPPFLQRGEPPAFAATWRAPAKESQGKPPAPAPAATQEPPMPAPSMNAAPARTAAASPRQKTYFDSMWPTEPADAKVEKAAEPKFQSPFAPPARAPIKPAAPSELHSPANEAAPETVVAWQEDEPVQTDEAHSVAILKSGVVDGMGYTLYVDGSIEAELPQGTLHFASINELRSHLEKTS